MHDLLLKAKPNVNLNRVVDLSFPDEQLMEEGELGVILEWLITGKDGKIIPERSGKKKAESFVRQFLELLWVAMDMVGSQWGYSLTNTDGEERTVTATGTLFTTTAAIADTTHGIVVGTDNTAPTINDYALGALIAHGTGAGQVQYGNVGYGLPTATVATSSFTIVRAFSNVSGGAITINEIGLYVKCLTAVLSPTGIFPGYSHFMTIRDVIAGGISLLDGETLTINYRFQGAI
ncbi:MAG: hypothetical protein WC551_09960 [Patescibacteria group bacterium]